MNIQTLLNPIVKTKMMKKKWIHLLKISSMISKSFSDLQEWPETPLQLPICKEKEIQATSKLHRHKPSLYPIVRAKKYLLRNSKPQEPTWTKSYIGIFTRTKSLLLHLELVGLIGVILLRCTSQKTLQRGLHSIAVRTPNVMGVTQIGGSRRTS